MQKLQYPNRPIGSIEALAKTLSISPAGLTKLSRSANRYYRSKTIAKKSGGTRQIDAVIPPLKDVQKRIQTRILSVVVYPDYIFAVKDKTHNRGAKNSAALHAGQAIVIKEDIKDFFPSISASLVCEMWQQFFHFPPEVAELLTALTTLNGYVPQGASTSSYIAAIIFWDREPTLEHVLRVQGFVYSRYVDDITISCPRDVTPGELDWLRSQVYGMLHAKGIKQNSRKTRALPREVRQTVHNANVNSGKPTLGKAWQKRVRAAVHKLEQMPDETRNTEVYLSRYNSVRGQIAHLRQFHDKRGDQLLARLKKIPPTDSDA